MGQLLGCAVHSVPRIEVGVHNQDLVFAPTPLILLNRRPLRIQAILLDVAQLCTGARLENVRPHLDRDLVVSAASVH